MPPGLTFYSVSLPKGLDKGGSLTLDVLAVFTNMLQSFPEKISRADFHLVVFQDTAYSLSPYAVKTETLGVKLHPNARFESYTKVANTKGLDSEIKSVPFENLPPFSYTPIVVHYENNHPFALVREVEISHWGNVQVIELYNLVHGGAESKGEFSTLDYQARPHVRGASAFRHLVAKLPPRARSVYYRDEIGNILTSHLWGDYKKVVIFGWDCFFHQETVFEPRYPMFGGWRTSFTVGYGLPLKDLLFEIEGKRFLNFSFESPINEVAIDKLIVKITFSHLDIVGRPVVPEKINVDSAAFQCLGSQLYCFLDFSSFLLHVLSIYACGFVNLQVFYFLSSKVASGRGDVQAWKETRMKELSRELKPSPLFLQSSPQAAQILPKVEELIAKEKELREKLLLKHFTAVDSCEKKVWGMGNKEPRFGFEAGG
ncbi:Ribophorin I [Dillenia turbinata]|uniref:Dolichyl-diphosphooligosaccharide--protein glycosyltransferase subunit 1 n=1 Tax=Dillenia turbinata TaxID=194707 RepID=A0AAN8ZLZ6_9MAGN